LGEKVVGAVRAPFKRLREGGQSASEWIWALKDASFEVYPGEVIGIIGRNGAGKSTLLKILSRITEPTAGRAELYGRVGSLLEVGTGFHPELTGRENVFLNGAILGMPRIEIERKFDEIVAFSEVEKFIDTPIKHYSSGMQMRLAFAVAAHLEPEILIVDEVLAVGDAEFQKKCMGKIGDVASQGRTVLFVSHNIGAVSSLCNRAVYLVEGRIRSLGLTEQIVADYLSKVFRNEVEGLDHLRLAGFGKSLRFRDIRLLNGEESTVLFGQPIKYALSIESDIDLKNLSIGSSIFNNSGACVGTLFTKEGFSIKARQQLELILTVSNMTLAPGSYYAGFSVGHGGRDGGRHDLDAVLGRPAFQVLPVSEEKEFIAGWHPNWGDIVFTDTELTITKG
jgi:lipopolysaccharide transport system ATP-binding protein